MIRREVIREQLDRIRSVMHRLYSEQPMDADAMRGAAQFLDSSSDRIEGELELIDSLDSEGCPDCGGTGEARRPVGSIYFPCPRCDGTGKVDQ